jgi:hypothetical protein
MKVKIMAKTDKKEKRERRHLWMGKAKNIGEAGEFREFLQKEEGDDAFTEEGDIKVSMMEKYEHSPDKHIRGMALFALRGYIGSEKKRGFKRGGHQPKKFEKLSKKGKEKERERRNEVRNEREEKEEKKGRGKSKK